MAEIKYPVGVQTYDANTKEYILGFPNREVSEGFWESLAKEFFIDRIGKDGNCLQDAWYGWPNGDPFKCRQGRQSDIYREGALSCKKF